MNNMGTLKWFTTNIVILLTLCGSTSSYLITFTSLSYLKIDEFSLET
jgi:hypothetical protein